jgi:hypothetical protein
MSTRLHVATCLRKSPTRVMSQLSEKVTSVKKSILDVLAHSQALQD